VEDDPALQRMILNYFEENNIHTLVAANRQEMVSQLGDVIAATTSIEWLVWSSVLTIISRNHSICVSCSRVSARSYGASKSDEQRRRAIPSVGAFDFLAGSSTVGTGSSPTRPAPPSH
jgi:hypothetical protein